MKTRRLLSSPSRQLAAGLGAAGLAAAAIGVLPAGASIPGGVHATAVVPVLFTVAAHAPVAQMTEDEPTAPAGHPEGEGDYGYTIVTADPTAQTAMAANVWPGSAAGNAGTLLEVLGAPSQAGALNDPAQASAATGSDASKTTTTPNGTTMSASVEPSGPNDQHTTATSSSAGGGLGQAGTIGNSTSTSSVDFRTNTGLLTVLARSSASNIDIAGVVKIGSETSSASAVADDGAKPTLSGSTDVHDMSVAGTPAYVDGGGVHLGRPGHPAGSTEVDAV
ncbi:MAG TPA: hypothetical protein VKI19_00080, partial [Acidimicrobiales bacterium]|nr:hypothetical protein [Acidimicrobiales bacterium]